jgi:hypothetical protein
MNRMDRIIKSAIIIGLAVMMVGANYPDEPWPADETIEALNGTTDDATGLPYIATGTSPQSSPALQVQLDRMFQRSFTIAAAANQLRVVKIDTTHVGIFPGYFRIGTTGYYYPGEANKSVTTDTDTYYVYLTSASDEGGAGTATIVTDGTGWPADKATFVPLASFVVADSAVGAITDRRGWTWYSSGLGSTLSAIGALTPTDSNIIVGDGSTWVAESGATARTSLGVAIGTNVQAYDPDLTSAAGLATSGLVFRTNETTWSTKAIGTDVQAYDGDLAALAGVASTGLWVVTGGGTGAVRTITAGTGITVTNGDGVSGNPTVAVTASTYQPLDSDLTALAGVASTGLWAVTGGGTGAVRTVTAGTGITVTNGDGVSGNPTVAVTASTYQPLDSDLTALAGVASTGLWAVTGSGTGSARTITGANGNGVSGNPTIGYAAALKDDLYYYSASVGSQAGQARTVTLDLLDAAGDALVARRLLRVWVSGTDYGAPASSGVTLAVGTGTVICDFGSMYHFLVLTDASGDATVQVTDSDGGTWYLCREWRGEVGSSEVIISAP